MSDVVERLREAALSARTTERVLCDKAADEIERLRARETRLRETLRRWQHYGCPDCGYDCSAANPPVSLCIMRETRADLGEEK
jgi:hypothetical protein